MALDVKCSHQNKTERIISLQNYCCKKTSVLQAKCIKVISEFRSLAKVFIFPLLITLQKYSSGNVLYFSFGLLMCLILEFKPNSKSIIFPLLLETYQLIFQENFGNAPFLHSKLHANKVPPGLLNLVASQYCLQFPPRNLASIQRRVGWKPVTEFCQIFHRALCSATNFI